MHKNRHHSGHNTFLLPITLLVTLENLIPQLKYGMIITINCLKHNMIMELILNVITSLVKRPNVFNYTETKQYIFLVHKKAFVVIILNKSRQKENF